MTESFETTPRRWSGLTGLFFGGIFLLVLELGWTIIGGRLAPIDLATPRYLAAVAALSVGLWLAHALPIWGLYRLARQFIARRELLAAAGAAVFGLSMQETLIHGDGIGSHDFFPLIRVGLLVGFPVVFAVFTWSILNPKTPPIQRFAVTAVALVAGVAFNLNILIEYQGFHGHLAVFNAALFVGITRPLWHRPMPQKIAVGLAAAVTLSGLIMISQQETSRTHVQRFSHLPASMSAGLPLGSILRVEPSLIFEFDKAASGELQEYYETFFGDESKFVATPPRGKNVLLVVLESVRADYWDDPELTPKFHEWKEQGVHFPRGIAQYPATPLAYGAIFAAQPPSVLAQTPYWGQNRLFDGVKDSFDHLYFSQPDISWFEHTAITDFFVPRDATVNPHRNGPAGLKYIRDNLSQLEDEESFFSWIHLYEPHDPYQAREPWVEGRSDDHSAYRSEIAYTDKHLGEFMNWFFEQPFAEETLVIVVADHGQGMGEEIMGEPFWGHHVHVNNIVSDIPMFFAGPGLPAQTREDSLNTMQLDVMPTIYDFKGVALPEEFMPQGNSIYHLLEERPQRPLATEAFSIRGHRFFEFVASAQQGDDVEGLRREFHRISTDGQRYSPKIGLQYGDYKIIYDRLLQRSWLYNIAADPQELHDIYSEEPDKAQMMEERLHNWNMLQGEVVRRLDELLE